MTSFQEAWEKVLKGEPVEGPAAETGVALAPAPAAEPPKPAAPAEVLVKELPQADIKGKPVRVFNNAVANALSDERVDCHHWNMLHVEVRVTGTTPSVRLAVQGADEGTSNYMTLPGPAAIRTVTASTSFEVAAPSSYAKIDLSNISGTFGAGQGFTVIVTPYAAQGPLPEPVPCSSSDVHAPAANTAAVVTYAAVAAARHVISGIVWSYAGGIPTGGNLKVEDVSGTTVFTMDISDEGAGIITFPTPKKAAAANTAMIITLAAGGAGVSGKVNMLDHWLEGP